MYLIDKLINIYLTEILGETVSEKEISEFRKLLANGSEKRRHIRIIGVGEERVGKTTLCKRILQRSKEEIGAIMPTEGIETHLNEATFKNGKIKVGNLTG